MIKMNVKISPKKFEMASRVGEAVKYQLTNFASSVTKELKRSALEMKKSGSGKKTSRLARSVGFKIIGGDHLKLVLGTGMGRVVDVPYAKIQDVGGITHPRVTPRMRKWAWFSFFKTKNPLFKAIALTKKERLDVKIPASRWFSSVWEEWEPKLKSEYLNKQILLKIAEKLSTERTNA